MERFKQGRTLSTATYGLGAILIMATAGLAHAATVTVGSVIGHPGDAVEVPINFSGSPDPASIVSFTVTLSITGGFAAPTVAAGADYPDLDGFVDDIAGDFRVTALVLSGANVGDGEVLKLTFTIPGVLPSGDYAIVASSLEVRDITNAPVPSTTVDGNITVNTDPTVTITGDVSVVQDSPAVTSDVATVADAEDLNGSLGVSVTGAPAGMTVTVVNNLGTVSATASADCTVIPGIYPITLTATDSGGFTGSANFNVNVAANPAPTVGTYGNIVIIGGNVDSVLPSAAPADANNNITSVGVSPTALPGGGTVAVNAGTGEVTITTTTSTTLGNHLITVTVTDNCGATDVESFTLTVTGPPTATTTGSVTTSQGGAGTTANVATVSDTEDAAGTLGVGATGQPAGMIVTVLNTAGVVSATATAACTVIPATYPITLTVTDSDLLTDTTNFDVIVTANPAPTLGAYADDSAVRGDSAIVAPAAAPADGNDNIATVEVSPTALPGGGTVSVDAVTGDVTVNTTATSTLGGHVITVTVTDDCGETAVQAFTFTVLSGIPGDENNDGTVDLGELTATQLAYRGTGPVPPTADTDDSGTIEFAELTVVLLHYRGLL